MTNTLEVTVSTPTTFIAVVENDHRVEAPPGMEIGARVLMVPMPLLTEMLEDTARRARFAATRQAIREAIQSDSNMRTMSDKEIVSLVRNARQTSPAD